MRFTILFPEIASIVYMNVGFLINLQNRHTIFHQKGIGLSYNCIKKKIHRRTAMNLRDGNILDGSTVFEPGLVKATARGKTHPVDTLYHSQKFWEFIYVDSGFALLGGMGNSVLMTAGDLAVVAPGETHSLVAPSDAVVFCCLFMDYELGNMRDEIFSLPGFIDLSARAKLALEGKAIPKNARFECTRLDFSERQELVRICEGIMRERLSKIRGWQQIVKSLLCQLLVFYSRLDVSAKRAERTPDGVQSSCLKVIRFLEDNFKSNITGAEVAEHVGLSADYMMKQFRAEFDISPADYLRRYRIAKSMELLCGTDIPINDVAESCGFVDFSAYSRVFKNLVGETPSAFRKRFLR